VVLSVLDAELELDGALDPAAAPLLGVLLLSLVLPLAAPEAGALFSVVVDEELELDGAGVLGLTVTDPLALVEPPAAGALLSVEDDELELDGAGVLGVVELVEPDEDVAPEPGVVRVTARSPSLSQPSNPTPSARDTATAKVESLM
jgi:hypothetical protein